MNSEKNASALKITRTTVRTGVRAGEEAGTGGCVRLGTRVFTTTVHGYTEICR